MNNSARKALVLVLWLLALMLAAWTLGQLPLGDIRSQLSQLAWSDWLLWLTVNLVIFYLAVQRWQLLGHALTVSLSLGQLFRLRQAGSAVSFLTPGPHFGGEPLQLYWLCRQSQLPLHRAVALLGLDRFMEVGTNLAVLLAGVLMLVGTALLPVGEWLQITVILVSVLAVMLALAVLVLSHPVWLAERFRGLSKRWQAPQNGWLALVELLRTALSNQRPTLWLALLLSLGGWVALLLEQTLLLHLLGLTPSWQDIVLIMVAMRLAMLLPVPGGIGTVEASVLWSFQLLGLPVSAAAGLIALIRLRDALVLLIGLGCLASLQGKPGAASETA